MGVSALDLYKLQCGHNYLVRILANSTKCSHIMPVRKTHRWLPIKHRSVFKTALLIYEFLQSDYLKYFELLLKVKHILLLVHFFCTS